METANALRADSRLGLVRRRRRAGAPGGLRDRDAGTGRRILRLVGDPGGVRRAGRRLRRRGAWAGSRPRRAATGDRPVGRAGLFYRPAHWRRRQEPFAGAGGRADEADAGGGAGTSTRRGAPAPKPAAPKHAAVKLAAEHAAAKSPLPPPSPQSRRPPRARPSPPPRGNWRRRRRPRKSTFPATLPKASRRRAAEWPTI